MCFLRGLFAFAFAKRLEEKRLEEKRLVGAASPIGEEKRL